MKRREFLKTMGLGVIGLGIAPEIMAGTLEGLSIAVQERSDDFLRDYLRKIDHFDDPHREDVQVDSVLYKIFESTVMRLRRLQNLVGHGNFQVLSFDGGLKIARKYSEVGKFTRAELRFMEIIFYEEGQRYGFLGQKPMKKITDRIKKEDIIKIPYSGNYLYKGKPNKIYREIRRELGEQVIMTSGVRGVMKQFLLFLNKAYSKNGNLSLASRSLAPPGYSFHGNGDFDVGQAGYGSLNFTEQFQETTVFKRLADMGYLRLRYPKDNLLGVRYEPWHIKVSEDI
jgi:hypothetical protein